MIYQLFNLFYNPTILLVLLICFEWEVILDIAITCGAGFIFWKRLLPKLTTQLGRWLQMRKKMKRWRQVIKSKATSGWHTIESKLYAKYKIAPCLPYYRRSSTSCSRFYSKGKQSRIHNK